MLVLSILLSVMLHWAVCTGKHQEEAKPEEQARENSMEEASMFIYI
jgi:hypothetical protein